LVRYAKGDRLAHLVAKYAQARFSSFPNVHWCISNDRDITDQPGNRSVSPAVINRIARDMRDREPWNTLLTNHQKRHSGYAFVDADWSDIVTLEDLDQVTGERVLEYVKKSNDPVVNDEDRYGIYRSPQHDRYFFRRFMWANFLSGGHPTYGGLNTFEAFEGDDKLKGVQGYLTAVRDGRLDDGARDFKWIRKFLDDAQLTFVGFRNADEIAGDKPMAAKAATDDKSIIVYVQNADSEEPESANVAETAASVKVTLPPGNWKLRWFNPRTGRWHPAKTPNVAGGSPISLSSPFEGDAVLLLQTETRS
jgi:hypothetical protein